MNNLINMLGLAAKKGDIVVGGKRVLSAVQETQNLYIFMARDLGDNTRKKLTDKARTYQIPCNQTFSEAELSSAIGRAHVKVVAIKDSPLMKHPTFNP